MINESKVCAIGVLALLATIACTTAQTTPASDPCVENGLTEGFLPHPNDCTKYYSCYGGTAYEMTCPDGKFFDPDRVLCDLAVNVACLPNNCPPEGIVFLPIPGVCNRFTICVGGAAFEGVCDDELYFDAVLGDCNLKNESGCIVNPCQQPPPNPPILEIFPNEADCRQYLICLAGEPVVRDCAAGLVFDPNTAHCVVGDECISMDGGATTVDPGESTTTDPETPITDEPETSTIEEPETTTSEEITTLEE